MIHTRWVETSVDLEGGILSLMLLLEFGRFNREPVDRMIGPLGDVMRNRILHQRL